MRRRCIVTSPGEPCELCTQRRVECTWPVEPDRRSKRQLLEATSEDNNVAEVCEPGSFASHSARSESTSPRRAGSIVRAGSPAGEEELVAAYFEVQRYKIEIVPETIFRAACGYADAEPAVEADAEAAPVPGAIPRWKRGMPLPEGWVSPGSAGAGGAGMLAPTTAGAGAGACSWASSSSSSATASASSSAFASTASSFAAVAAASAPSSELPIAVQALKAALLSIGAAVRGNGAEARSLYETARRLLRDCNILQPSAPLVSALILGGFIALGLHGDKPGAGMLHSLAASLAPHAPAVPVGARMSALLVTDALNVPLRTAVLPASAVASVTGSGDDFNLCCAGAALVDAIVFRGLVLPEPVLRAESAKLAAAAARLGFLPWFPGGFITDLLVQVHTCCRARDVPVALQLLSAASASQRVLQVGYVMMPSHTITRWRPLPMPVSCVLSLPFACIISVFPITFLPSSHDRCRCATRVKALPRRLTLWQDFGCWRSRLRGPRTRCSSSPWSHSCWLCCTGPSWPHARVIQGWTACSWRQTVRLPMHPPPLIQVLLRLLAALAVLLR